MENLKLNPIEEKDNSPDHFCDGCELPVKIYGQMMPSKHAFYHDCAEV